jgi:choline dehydrogenase
LVGEDSVVEFDYIVVGAGAAGCVVAGRLAAAEGRPSVLLIEYGGSARNPLLRVPKGFYYTLRGDRYLYRYVTNPVGPKNNSEVWLRGRVLGGSAAVNGMVWMRGAPADWDALADRGNPGWSWADVLPAYRAIENHSLGASDTRGAGGPLGISVTDAKDEITSAILASAVQYGWRQVGDVNAEDTERVGFTPSTIARGRRTTSYGAFVRPVLAGQRAGRGTRLTVATRTRAVSLTFDGHRVTGVTTVDGTGTVTGAKARREVILCAGSVETPLLLERSGIGGPALLREHGIELRAESPNVGERLIEQRGAALQMRLNGTSAATRRLHTKTGQAREALRWLATGTGLLATGGYDLVCQFKSDPREPRPDVQGLFAPLALDTASEDMKLARHPGILFMGYPIRPETTSSVHISGGSPHDPPVIDARFLETGADQAAVAPVLEIARAVLAQAPAGALIRDEEFPGPSVATTQDTIEYSRTTGTGIYHAVGSAAMGPSDDDVVDAQLRVRGVTGLRVADASVLPRQVSGNTAAPAMLVGYRAADLILGDLRPGRFLVRDRAWRRRPPPPGDDPPDHLDDPADHQGPAEGDRESHERLILERLPAEAPGQEGVRGPDDGRDGGSGAEPPPGVPDQPAAQGHRRPATGDEPTDDDEPHSEPAQRPFRPVAPGRALGPRSEEPPRRPRPKPPPDQVRQVVPDERAGRRAQQQQEDPGIGGPGGRYSERDEHRLARHDRQHRVQAGQQERDQVGERRTDLQARDPAHWQPASSLVAQWVGIPTPPLLLNVADVTEVPSRDCGLRSGETKRRNRCETGRWYPLWPDVSHGGGRSQEGSR